MPYSAMLRHVAHLRTFVSEERIPSITLTIIGELVTANVPSSPILVTLMMEQCLSPKRRF
jgi:hypothetical protein